jgi:hypothetical protein
MRLIHRAKIRLMINDLHHEYVLDMKDFSESGLYLFAPRDVMPEMGAIVEVQTTEFDDAPLQTAKVVRIEEGVGFAVEFIQAASGSDV